MAGCVRCDQVTVSTPQKMVEELCCEMETSLGLLQETSGPSGGTRGLGNEHHRGPRPLEVPPRAAMSEVELAEGSDYGASEEEPATPPSGAQGEVAPLASTSLTQGGAPVSTPPASTPTTKSTAKQRRVHFVVDTDPNPPPQFNAGACGCFSPRSAHQVFLDAVLRHN
eukprot:RCo041323